MKKCPKLSVKQLEELRDFKKQSKKKSEIQKAVAILLLNNSTDASIIEEATEYSLRRAFSLRKVYLEKGIASIRSKDNENHKILTKIELSEITLTLQTQTPKELNYLSDYWTTSILGRYIEEKYNAVYKSRTSYYLLFKKSKLTFHKPGKVYKNHDEAAVEKWKNDVIAILNKAWNDDTVILTEDEMVLKQTTIIQRIWLPQGEYPQIVESTGTRKNKSLYGFLNLKTGVQNVYSADTQNMYVTRRMLYKIRKLYPDKKILLFWDNPGWHRGSVVMKYIKKDANIQIVNYPAYAPDLNPQEHVWKAGREHITHNKFIDNLKRTTREFVRYLNSHEFKYSLLDHVAI